MKYFNKFTNKFANVLKFLTVTALGILGIYLVIVLFMELFSLGRILITTNNIFKVHLEVLDEVIVFFLFFEFAAMIFSALKHNGDTSVNFLMGLGVTAPLRGLISAHGEPIQFLVNAVSILLLIIGMVIMKKHIKM